MASTLTIGRAARSLGVNPQTLRYYERRRLVEPAARKPSGYRLYDDETLRRLRFIKNAQALGFTLREVAQLLNLRIRSTARCGDVQRNAQAKLAQIKGKIVQLRALERALKHLIGCCRAGLPTDRCPILHSLEENQERRRTHAHRKTTR